MDTDGSDPDHSLFSLMWLGGECFSAVVFLQFKVLKAGIQHAGGEGDGESVGTQVYSGSTCGSPVFRDPKES